MPYRLLLLLALCLLARGLLLLDLRVYPTGDQGAYLRGAEIFLSGGGDGAEIFHDRLPGFPAFLAPLLALFGHNAWAILLAHAALGTASAALAWRLARQLGAAPWGALVAGAFVGLQPLYLFSEHQVMAETLALFLTLAGAVFTLDARDAPGEGSLWRWGLAGVVLSASVVTRSNGLFFAGLVGLGVAMLPAAGSRLRRVLVMGAGLATLVVPWVVRNYVVEGRWVLSANVPTARLVYVIHQGLFDPTRPSGQKILSLGYKPEAPVTIFEALKSLDPDRIGREAHIEPLLADQLAGRNGELALAAARSAAAFLGWREGLSPMKWWLSNALARQEALTRLEERTGFPPQRLAHARGSRLTGRTETWRHAALAYLAYGRRVLALVLIGCLALALRRRTPLPLVLLAGYLATAALHGAMLADHDRFTMVWDWLVVVLAVALWPPGLKLFRPSPTAPPVPRS